MKSVGSKSVTVAVAGLCACVAGLIAGTGSAHAAITCTYNSAAGTLTAQGTNGDSGVVRVVAGDAVQVFDLAISDSTPRTCGGDPGPATIANTDIVNLTDGASGANVFWNAENPERWTSGGNETEVTVAPGTGTDTFATSDTNTTTDLWALGANGFDWNNTADVDVAFLGAADQILLLGGDGGDAIIANPIQIGGPFSGATRLEIRGGSGSDFLAGGNTDDRLVGRDGSDTIQGVGGADILLGGSGTNELNGGNGVDRADYNEAPVGVNVDLNRTDRQGTGFSADTFIGIEGVIGSPHGDTLVGNDGVSPLDGGLGNDALDGRGGADPLSGGPGVDAATYAQAPGGVSVDLSTAPGTATGAAGNDTLDQVENLTGSPSPDTLVGSALANSITGLAGADTVSALGGADDVQVRDGEADTASCGTELDSATADQASVDSVNADCETVSFLPEAATGDGGGGGDGGGDGEPPGPDVDLSFELSGKAKQRVLKQKGVVVTASCPLEDCAVAFAGKVKPRSEDLAAAEAELLRLKLKRAKLRVIAKALRAGKKPKVKVAASVADAAGNVAAETLIVKAKP